MEGGRKGNTNRIQMIENKGEYRMHILYLEHYAGSDRHGMEYRPFYMARRWVRSGDDVTIVASSFSHMRGKNPELGGRPYAEEWIDGVRYFWIKGPCYQGNGWGRIRNILSYLRGVYRQQERILAGKKPDVVIASSTYPLDIYPARRIAKKYGAQLVYEMHDLWPLSPMELGGMGKYHPFILAMQKAENDCYRWSDYVVSLLPKAKEHMVAHGMAAGKFVYIPNGVIRTDWGREETAAPPYGDYFQRAHAQGWFLIGYTGAHGVANALDSFVEAGKELRGTKIRLVMVGRGPERDRLMKKIQELGVQENVEALPAVEKEQIPALLSQFDALYIGLQRQPLFRFGVSPNKLMDYMMAAKPVIFAVEAGNDLVAEAGCGFSILPEDSRALALAARRMAATPLPEREKMGERGRAYILQNNEYDVLSERFRGVFLRGKFPPA